MTSTTSKPTSKPHGLPADRANVGGPLLEVEQAKTLAFRFAAAFVARRLYANGNPTLGRKNAVSSSCTS